MSALTISDPAQTSDIDTYMAEQGEELPSTSSAPLSTPAQKLATVERLCNAPMRVGETWYVVSRSWFRRWRKACSGEVDKEGPLEEKDLGPVDNSSIITGDGNTLNPALDSDDYTFVPEQVWRWFIEWYGEPRFPLPRKVIARGIQAEPSLELHSPQVKLHVLTDTTVPGVSVTPRTLAISVKDSIEDVLKKFAQDAPVHDRRAHRVWKLTESDISWEQLSCTPEQLKQRGGTLLEPSQKAVEDEMIDAGDAFVIEYQSDDKWVVEASDVPAQSGIASTSTSQSTVTGTAPKLFGTGRDFFSQMQTKAPALKPSISIKSGPVSNTRSKGTGQEPGTLGLGNMGNTCFMNSALQCLAHTKELTDYFLSGVFEEELNFDNPLGMHGAIAQAFGALLRRIWTSGSTSSSYSPREFKQALQRFAPQFSGYQQHDSQELVAFLLDGLHEDLNRVLKKPYVEKPDWEGGGDKELVELANESWQGYMKRNDSVIVDLFQGQYQSTLVCPECNKVSITFDPFMYLTLPLPVQKKWKHTVYYVPWSLEKPHVRIPVELNRDASFRELRQLLGRWMGADPDHLLTLETFSHRFYKDLDDTISVGDMTDNDIVVCFELPCHVQQSRTHKPQPDDPYVLPVFLCDFAMARQTYSRQSLFGYPFIVVIDHKQATDPDAMYDAVVDRLQRWTDHVRDLFTWEAGTPSSMEPVHIPISDHSGADSVTEINENGDIITVAEPALEEGDITDEKDAVVQDQDDIRMDTETDDEPRKVCFKKDIFDLRVQSGSAKYGVGYGSYPSSSQRFEAWESRALRKKDAANLSAPELLQEGDALYCEFDENMKAYYFGDERNCFQHARWDTWEEFVHPEYAASRKAAAAKIDRGISLQDCLDEFTKEEKLGEDDLWYCPRCKKHQQATKRFDLWKVPDVLVVHLKRFSNSRTLRDKIDTFVDFPVEGLDISDMVGERQVTRRLMEQEVDIAQLGLSDLDEPLIYDLYAVDEHLGGLGGGHYRAYAYNHVTEKWYHFDDSYVTPSRPEAAVNSNAYLLFYRRRTSRPLGGKSYARIEAARNNPKMAVEISQDQVAQLPTPPLEATGLAALSPFASVATQQDTLASLTGLRPYSDNLPASLSPPPLGAPPSFEEAQFDDVVTTSLDPLALSAHQFDFPDPSSRNSPSSSIEAEPDLEDVEKDIDSLEDTDPLGPQWAQDNFYLVENNISEASVGASSPSSSSLDGYHLRTESSDEDDRDETSAAVRISTPLSDVDVVE